MSKYVMQFMTLVAILIVGAFFVFLTHCISSIAGFIGQFNPMLEPWFFWGLVILVGSLILWLGILTFVRPKPLLVYANPSPEEIAQFRVEMVKRLKKNKQLRDAEVVINDVADIDVGLVYLKELANDAIVKTAKRVFITTGISQNGRLDTLIVFFLVARLIWQVAKIYNQRPHYRELMNLYANIVATAFIAGSIEECGLDVYVHELMGPLLSGSAIGTVPGAQAISGIITTSVLDGTTNCLMTLRCGIIARNYLSLQLDAQGKMRHSATVEASKIFVSISSETVVYVTKSLVKGASEALKSRSTGAARSVGVAVSEVAGRVGKKAHRAETGVVNATRNLQEKARKAKRGVELVVISAGGHCRKMSQTIVRTARNAGLKTAKRTQNACQAGVGLVSVLSKKVKSKRPSLLQKIKRQKKDHTE